MVKFRTKKKIINVPNLMKGFPHPENIALSQHLEELVRDNGGVPATIGVLNGIAKVGFEAKELKRLLQPSSHKKPIKISRRDLAYICGLVCVSWMECFPKPAGLTLHRALTDIKSMEGLRSQVRWFWPT